MPSEINPSIRRLVDAMLDKNPDKRPTISEIFKEKIIINEVNLK